jgi:hypothetical protein
VASVVTIKTRERQLRKVTGGRWCSEVSGNDWFRMYGWQRNRVKGMG